MTEINGLELISPRTYGEHFCIGFHLARASRRAMLRELVSRIDSLELAGKPEQIQSSFVVGPKELPLRYRVSQSG